MAARFGSCVLVLLLLSPSTDCARVKGKQGSKDIKDAGNLHESLGEDTSPQKMQADSDESLAQVSMQSEIDTVGSIDLQAFLGRWYQMYGSISSTILTFGNAGPQDLCTSADYSLNSDGSTIDVLNQGIRPDGRVTKIWGTVKPTDKPGQRKLSFSKFVRGNQTVQPPDFEGDYWIYHLGPKVDGKYAYAIVGGPAAPRWGLDKTQLFVLARDPANFLEEYDNVVHEWLHANSFSWWWNKPRATGSIGKWRWFPYPSFSDGDNSHGDYGQDGCAKVEELSAPVDGSVDTRD